MKSTRGTGDIPVFSLMVSLRRFAPRYREKSWTPLIYQELIIDTLSRIWIKKGFLVAADPPPTLSLAPRLGLADAVVVRA